MNFVEFLGEARKKSSRRTKNKMKQSIKVRKMKAKNFKMKTIDSKVMKKLHKKGK